MIQSKFISLSEGRDALMACCLLLMAIFSQTGESSSLDDSSLQQKTIEETQVDDQTFYDKTNELESNDTSIDQELEMLFIGRCRGIARSCSSINSRISCNSQDGCRWSNNDCKGNARTCMLVRTESKCKSIRGCRWSD